MLKTLIAMEGGMAVVFDLPLLDIIGASGATELELTTDGRRLILTPVASSRRSPAAHPLTSTTPSPASSAPPLLTDLDAKDPKTTVRVIELLQQRFGFGQEQFRQLHHFGPTASLQAHLKYCRRTGRFTSETNVIVCRRLQLCLLLLSEGAAWPTAIATATKEHPFPP